LIELENTVKYMGLEVDRLNQLLREEEEENDNWRQKYINLEE